jgi:hypothetical protein
MPCVIAPDGAAAEDGWFEARRFAPSTNKKERGERREVRSETVIPDLFREPCHDGLVRLPVQALHGQPVGEVMAWTPATSAG